MTKYEKPEDRDRQKQIIRFLQTQFDFFKEQPEFSFSDFAAYIQNNRTLVEVKWLNCESTKYPYCMVPKSKVDKARAKGNPQDIHVWFVGKYTDVILVWDLRTVPIKGERDQPRPDRPEIDPVCLISIMDAIHTFPIELF